jgi:peptide/nickel transport system permease protein
VKKLLFTRVLYSIGSLLLLLLFLTAMGPYAMDPTYRYVGANPSAEDIATVRRSLGLAGSLPERYLQSLRGIFTLELGRSFRTGARVVDLIAARAPRSALIGAIALVLSIAGGMLVAIQLHGRRHETWFLGALAVVGLGVPVFVSASVAAELLAPLTGKPIGAVAVAGGLLALPGAAFYGIVFARRLQQARSERFVLYSEAVGLPGAVISRDLIRLASVEALAIVGNQIPIILVGGTVVVEYSLRIEGLGLLLVDASLWMDYPVLRAALALASLLLLLGFLAVDMVHRALDPRWSTS